MIHTVAAQKCGLDDDDGDNEDGDGDDDNHANERLKPLREEPPEEFERGMFFKYLVI